MKVLEAKIHILYQPINENDKVIENIAAKLKNSYEIATLSSAGILGEEQSQQNVPNDIPRIIGTSKGKHSEISISLNKADISIAFDSKYSEELDKCIEYIEVKAEEVYDSLNEFIPDNFLFSGITVTTVINEASIDPIKVITNNNYANLKTNKTLYDVGSKFAYVVEDKHFVNINISNARGIEEIQNSLLNPISKKVNYLSITFDVNDRFGFNEIPNYKSNYENLKNNVKIIKRLCNEELEKIINGGELNI